MIYFNKDKNNLGFTLIETTIIIFIFSLLALGTSYLFYHLFISSNNRLASIGNFDQTRVAISRFANELRMASIGGDGSHPINEAGNSEIIFFSGYGQAEGIISRNRYFVQANTLYKGTIIPSDNRLIYDLENEIILPIQNNVNNESIFYYYDGNHIGSSTPLTQPININDIRFVRINLNILKQTERTATSSFDVETGVSLRNLKDNLND